MNIGEKAASYHGNGFNCAQSVLAAFCEEYGVDMLTARRIASGFGGGLRCGEACGALAGAMMALGLATCEDGNGSMGLPMAERGAALSKAFREKYGTVRCSELLAACGGDKSKCNEFIATAAELAAAAIEEYKK